MKNLTIQQAGRTVFSGPDTKIPRSTIQTFMQRGVFVPAEPAPHRDPRGCKMDIPDLVTLLVLRGLSICGVGYKSMDPDRLRFDPENFAGPQGNRNFEKARRQGRGIQFFIEAHHYEVHAVVFPTILWTGHEITFRPSRSLDSDWWHRMKEGKWPQPLILLNVKPQFELVKDAIE